MGFKRKKTVVFTGGGSAGHVTPNIALINKCLNEQWHVAYIGSRSGLEKELIRRVDIPFFSICTGKLRRYFSWQNFVDPFEILFGALQALFVLLKVRPCVVFSKGGFVAVPVVAASWVLRIPVILHESDLTPGLANKLCFPFAKTICVTFYESKKYLPAKNVVVTGAPIRENLLRGDSAKGRAFCGFHDEKRVLLIFGGGLGALKINLLVRELLPKLLPHFNVVHLCGNGKVDATINFPGYKQFEFLHDELADILALADLVVSRAGSNAIFELLTLQKPHLLIPLSKAASRGDQIVNAEHFAKEGFSRVLNEEKLTADSLLVAIMELDEQLDAAKGKLGEFEKLNSIELIYDILAQYC
ncbi:MAG: undecaprenyldiphospho-muramoylpentapeptide beta-N-acetylglucosaminyltransferase [Gammaproteobacteria bacterium]|nr:undecaprenyldiphospho-muramoylpentapeptide beta-N-acetylglucosaminyltransferase [Gammaproteobacteria bacterium]